MGFGQESIEFIPTDVHFRIDISELEKRIKSLVDSGVPILAVIGILGTTEEGAIDEVHRIVELRNKLENEGISFWIHVDAAYGGYARSIFLDENFELIPLDIFLKMAGNNPTFKEDLLKK